ncbi:MAG: WD40 repeat domain-containing protein [Bdellovibrionales bacterium]
MSSLENEVQIPIIRPLWLNITEEPVLEVGQLFTGEWVAGLADGRIRVLDQKNGQTLCELSVHKLGLLGFSLHSTRALVASRGEDNQILILEYANSALKIQKKWKAKQWIDTSLWVGEDLIFSSGKLLYVWKSNSDEPQLIETWTHSISSLSITRNGEIGVVGYSRLSLYSWPELEVLKSYEWKGSLENLKFCNRNRFAVCSSNDMTLHVWDLKKDKDLAMRGFQHKILDLSFRFDGLYLANASGPEVMIWDFMDPGPSGKKPQVLGPFERPIQKVIYQPKGKILATFGQDGVILFWRPDLFDDRPLAISGIRDQAVVSAEWSLDNSFVVTGLSSGYVACYETPEVTKE